MDSVSQTTAQNSWAAVTSDLYRHLFHNVNPFVFFRLAN